MSRSILFATLLAIASFAGAARAQTSVQLSYIDASGNPVVLSQGSTISFTSTPVASTASVTVVVSNRGTQAAVFGSVAVAGDGFQLSGAPLPGTSIGANGELRFTVQFVPRQIGPATGILDISAGDQVVRSTLSGVGIGPAYAYTFLSGASTSPLAPGQTITFADTGVGARTIVTITVRNTGNAPGRITNIAVSGSGFLLADIPFLPVTVNPGASQTLSVAFAPTQPGRAAGRLLIGDDAFNLASNGIGADLQFSFAASGADVPLPTTAGTISITPVAIGRTASTTVKIANRGTAPAVISNISVDDASHVFSLSGAPALPLRLDPGSEAVFTISFTPVSTGSATGTLRIDANTFSVVSSGIGPALVFSYAAGGGDTPLPLSGGTISFAPVAVGETQSIPVKILNSGAAPAVINSISVDSGGGFSVAGTPRLPLQLDPGGAASFNVVFAPSRTGSATGTLRIDANTINLVGSANAPAPLSSVVFDGASGNQPALAQPSVGLSLSSPYPLALTGTLALSFDSDVFSDDPSIQFSSGGRTAAFTIPANSTRAVFANNSQQVRLQTGSVAGSINLKASFSTDAGLALEPASGATLKLTIPQGAPRVTDAKVDLTTNGFVVSITGLATGRKITQIALQFAPVAGLGLSIPNTTLNVESSFTSWYQSPASQQFGSLFTIGIPFTLSGQVEGRTNLADAVQSVTVTVTNAQGSSPPQTVSLH